MEKELWTLEQKGIIHFLIAFFWDITCNFQWLQDKFIFLLLNSNFKYNMQILFIIITLHEILHLKYEKFYDEKRTYSFWILLLLCNTNTEYYFLISTENFDISFSFLINTTAASQINRIFYCSQPQYKVIEIYLNLK